MVAAGWGAFGRVAATGGCGAVGVDDASRMVDGRGPVNDRGR